MLDLIGAGSRIEAEADPARVWALGRDALAQAGLPFVIHLASNADRSQVRLRTTLPELYEGVCPSRDPFLEWCCNSYEVTRTGGAYLDGYQYLPVAAQDFIARASALGFRAGLGLPMRLAGSDRFGGFNIGCGLEAPAFEALIADRVDTLRAFCLILHRRLEELDRATPPAAGLLSPREADVMALIAEGLTRKDIARQLDLSPNTVADYTRAIYRKLGVGNRVAATKAWLGR